MANYLKPQSPLQHKDGNYFYPLTTIDQIIDDNGNRLNANIIGIDLNGAIEGAPNKINADTLQGYTAEDFFNSKSSDVQLNYSIIGSVTQPTNPTQNMIWINTNVPVGKVFFNKNRPEEQLANGDIWICTGTSSTASFNALKINNNYIDTIYPRYAKQMQNNNLIDVTAMSYLNNKWINWIDELVLYSNGILNTDYTSTGVVTKQTNYLEFKTMQSLNTFGQNIIFSEEFNSDAYSKVYINYELVDGHLLSGTMYQSHELILCDEYNNIIISAALNVSGHTEIDLSTVAGVNCYIGLRSYHKQNWTSGTLSTITKIYDLGVAV